jgi:copper transport protein
MSQRPSRLSPQAWPPSVLSTGGLGACAPSPPHPLRRAGDLSSSGERLWARLAAGCGAVVLGVLFSLLLPAQPAAAHAVLVESQPADGATLDRSPSVVRLGFSEDISPRLSSARIVDSSGRTVAGTRVAVDRGGSRLLTMEVPPLPDGAYGVVWQVMAADDGHTTSGVVVFAVGRNAAPSGLSVTAGGTAGIQTRPIDVTLRWLHICLLAGQVGGLAVAGLVLSRAPTRGPPAPGGAALSMSAVMRAARRRVLR